MEDGILNCADLLWLCKHAREGDDEHGYEKGQHCVDLDSGTAEDDMRDRTRGEVSYLQSAGENHLPYIRNFSWHRDPWGWHAVHLD